MAAIHACVSSMVTIASSFIAPHSCSSSLFSSQCSANVAPAPGLYFSVRCGRGDKRTAKGKRARGSFGNSRPKDSTKGRGVAITPLPPRPPKKGEFDDGEYIQVDIDETLFAN